MDWFNQKIAFPIILFLEGVKKNALRTWNLWITKGKTKKEEEKRKRKRKRKKEKVRRAF